MLPSDLWVACSDCGAETKFMGARAGTRGSESCRTCYAALAFGFTGARLEEVRVAASKVGGGGRSCARDTAGKKVKMVCAANGLCAPCSALPVALCLSSKMCCLLRLQTPALAACCVLQPAARCSLRRLAPAERCLSKTRKRADNAGWFAGRHSSARQGRVQALSALAAMAMFPVLRTLLPVSGVSR